MNRFDDELKKGNFVTSECTNCKKIVWPPSNYCNNCFKHVNWRRISLYGKIIEWSKNDNDIFCITEFENTIRTIGKLDENNTHLKSGQTVRLTRCGLDTKYRFFLKLADKQQS